MASKFDDSLLNLNYVKNQVKFELKFYKKHILNLISYVYTKNRKPSELNVNDSIVVQHKVGKKIAGQIEEKLDQLLSEKGKGKAVELAHKKLQSFIRHQRMRPETNLNKNLPLPPHTSKGDNNNI